MVSTPDNKYMQDNDPYKGKVSHQTRPDNIKSAQDSLKKAENIATNSKSLSSSINPRSAEQPTSSHIKNSVQGLPKNSNSNKPPKNGKGSGFLKGKGPLTIILMMLLGGGALIFGGQSILGPHLSSLYTGATDIQYTSYSLRNQRLVSYMLDGGDQIKTTTFSKKFTTFTPYMKSRLAKNGIEVGHLDANGDFLSGDILSGKSRVLRYNGEIIGASDFAVKYAGDANFRDAYYKAKRGRVAGFFDDASDFVYRKLGITRNIFDDYTATGNSATDAKNFEDTLSKNLGGAETDIGTAGHKTDDGGTPDDPSDDTSSLVKNGDDVDVNKVDGDTPEIKARSFATDLVSKVSNAGGLVCTGLRVANLANIAAFATSTANSINYFMGITENISKMMAGEGDASAINDVLNFFTTPSTSEVTYTNAAGETVTETKTGSPLESNGSRVVLGGITPTEYQTSAYSLESIVNSAKRTAVVSGGTSIACSGVQAASSIISLAVTGIPGGTIAKVVIGMVAETVGGIIITGALVSVISAIIPTIARVLFTNVLEGYTGVAAGELYSQGAAAANYQVAKTASAYVPSDATTISANSRATTEILALDAELDRLNRSPFDITSNNTFLGSIMSSFLALYTNSSALSSFSTISSLTSSALSNLLPSTFAADSVNTTFTTTYGNCPTLDEIGVKGDIYCNAIPATDLSTIDIEPDDPTYETIIMNNMSSDGTKVKDGSELAKFINFCANRESPFGVTDANILNALQTDMGIVVNNVPFLNDVMDIINAAEDAANQDWATGAICTNTGSNNRWDNEFKYYQRYIEDTRILDQMGAYEEDQNPILAYQEKYYEENPLDNSYEGYLARITGMTKNDIAFMLEFAEYSEYLANYEPSSLSPIIAEEKPEPSLEYSNRTPYHTETSTTISHIIYTDTRSRSYAV